MQVLNLSVFVLAAWVNSDLTDGAFLSTSTLSFASRTTSPILGASNDEHNSEAGSNRRDVIQTLSSGVVSAATATLCSPLAVIAEDLSATAAPPPPVKMKEFIDPKGLFKIRVPERFFTLRRSAKGDLPDAKTGQGRRGSSIFTAGDMAKAEVVAVERFPTAVLLEEAGISPTGDISTFPNIGQPAAVATLINLRRERDKPTQTKTVLMPDSISLSADGKTLSFSLRTEIDVQKPELLLEQYGVSELFRITNAKATLASNDGQMMAVFASALEMDYKGVDGAALRDTVESFTVTDQSS